MAKLTDQERVFAEHYLICWNGAEAARRAAYSEHTARQQASRLLKKAVVKKYIDARLEELKMSANEVLVRLADHARGSMGDFLSVEDTGWVSFNFGDAKKNNKLHLVKKFKIKPNEFGTEYELELYSAQDALVTLGKAHQLWTDKIDLLSGGKPINPIFAGLPDDDGGSDGGTEAA